MCYSEKSAEWFLFRPSQFIINHACPIVSQTYKFDFLILCVGRYGVTKVPTFPPNRGPEVFHGQVIHTMDYSGMEHGDAAEMIRGKRVVVVGSGKSGLDTAAQCAEANGDTGLLSSL
jgi:dimethylaniline monooxygenase (N-oxide forming)